MLLNQVSNNFFKSIEDESLIAKHLPEILDRFEKNISANENKYYWKQNENGDKEAFFDPLHTCQWALFLYLASNTIYKNETEKKEAARVLCDKIYGQLKIVSGCDLYYEVEMPEVFKFEHPTGSYIGRARFGEGFSFEHDCSVSCLEQGVYPVIGNNVSMKSGSSIIGNSVIGDNCVIMPGTMIKDENVPDNSIVSGMSPNLIIK